MPKLRSRGRKLHLVFDDSESGYTIRKLHFSPRSGEGSREGAMLPPVFAHISAPRGLPRYLTSAFGTKILVLHTGASDGTPVFDVKDRSFSFGPVPKYPACPIYFPIAEDRLFVLDIATFDFCRMKPFRAEMLVWRRLPYPPFRRHEVRSYAAAQHHGYIFVSTKSDATTAMVTYSFDTETHDWNLCGDWAFPFTGHGYYAPTLGAFVGLSKDPETLGYLYSCRVGTGDIGNTLPPSHHSCSKKTLYTENPAERHVSATLVRMHGDKFCLVECVDTMVHEEPLESWVDELDPGVDVLEPPGPYVELLEPGVNEDPWESGAGILEPVAEEKKVLEPVAEEEVLEPECEEDLYEGSFSAVGDRFMYRLKTFSVRYDREGYLKLEDCQVRCYRVPPETSIEFILQDPVAFCL
ncbi:unnamed protein product [Urochloa humidicola]